MRPCCPAGRGCNAADRDEVCVLTLFRAFSADEPAAALALERWAVFEDVFEQRLGSDGGLRFRRRAYERVRNRALVAITMRSALWLIDSRTKRRRRVSGRIRLRGARPAHRAP